MKVNQIALNNTPGPGLERPKQKNHNDEQTGPPDKIISSTELSDQTTEAESQIQSGEQTQHTKGVIRLLQEGHFKGVADVRLRINFFEELAAIEGAHVRAVAGESVSGLTEAVVPHIQGLVESGQISQELADTLTDDFRQTVNQIIESFVNGQVASREALEDKLNSALQSLLASLAAMEAQETTTIYETDDYTAPVEEILEEVALDDITPEPTEQNEQTQGETEGEEQADDLTSAFAAALRQFISSIYDTSPGGASGLPPLSEPQGNGVAYQKFLDIYNELRGVTNETPAPETEILDVVT